MQFEISESKQQKLMQVCQKYYVRKLSIFGSTLRNEARTDSDLDVLVEFIPGHTPGFAFMSLQDELSTILERTVDLRTAEDLSKYFRETVVQEARAIYAHR
ncbi:MAG TPA: nucleotidyltransferase family protein [Bacteroidota bacterium]